MPIPPNIPWDQVLRHGPKVLDAATALFEKWQSRRPEPAQSAQEAVQNPLEMLQALENRLHTLEAAEAEQSALVRDMAREMQGMAAELQRQRTRNRFALGLAIAALALAVLALAAARMA